MKRLEISLWDNCKNNCAFCWTARSPKANKLKIENQIKSIQQAIEIINNSTSDDILITGGEIFDSTDPELVSSIKAFLNVLFDHFRYNSLNLFIITNLINSNKELLNALCDSIDNFKDKKRIHITTSYDVVGRFHSKQTKEEFFDNLSKLGQKLPASNLIVNTILTKSACEAIVHHDISIFDLEKKNNCIWNVIPFVSNIPEETPTKQLVFDALTTLEDDFPGFSERFIPDLISHVENVAIKLNGSKEQLATAKLSSCGHSVNYSQYCSDSNTCFLCDVDEFFNITKKRNGFISVELWPDCTIGCPFCLNQDRKSTTSKEIKIEILSKVYDFFQKHHYSYETLQILGGEFFNGEIDDSDVLEAFKRLATLMNNIAVKYHKKIYIYSALKKLNKFDDIIQILLKNIKYGQVVLNSSFNFKTTHFLKDGTYINFKDTIDQISKSYPTLKIHLQSLITNQLIKCDFEEVKAIYKPFIDKNIEIDFHPIAIVGFNTWENHNREEFRQKLKNNTNIENYAIQHRSDALDFIRNAYFYFGKDCIENLTTNKTRPDTKWIVKSDLFQNDLSTSEIHCDNKCGHTYHLANAYLDSDKCMSCDVINLLEILGE